MTGELKGAVVKRIALLAVAAVTTTLALSSCVRLAQESSSDDFTVNDQLTAVRIDNTPGDVKIRSVEGTTATTIKRTLRYGKAGSKPGTPTHQANGGVLTLKGCGNGCEAYYEVTVPSKATTLSGELGSGNLEAHDLGGVDVNLGSGDATLSGISGAVKIDNSSGNVQATDIGGAFTGKVSSGNVRLSGVRGAINVDNGSGEIRGEQLDGDITARASSGNVTLELTKPHSVRADAGSGDVTVTVPASGTYKVKVDKDSGDKDIAVNNDPAGQYELVLAAGSGNVTVKSV
jgi:hypothetical protein